jgi:hypothetical protein
MAQRATEGNKTLAGAEDAANEWECRCRIFRGAYSAPEPQNPQNG